MHLRIFAAAISLLFVVVPAAPQASITTPRAQFGSDIGDDYFLVNYTQMLAYWQKLDRESDRMTVVEIGKTAEGRPMTMAILTSPENHRNLARYREIAERLARAENLPESEARRLAAEGKAVVWIDGGIHADETLGAQQLIETVYRLAAASDAETARILADVIVLASIANPDGMEMVSNWYMREPDPMRRSLSGMPVLYHKYAGHDDNRDFYMSAVPETQAINGVLYRSWYPQIVYDHHQTGPQGTVMFSPPFRDPFNFNLDPLVITMLEEAGGAMHSRFIAEDKPGVVTRSAANYSTWWNGGLRTSPYFHNMIGLLTETIGNPTPMQIPFVASRQLPGNDVPYPIAPQTWHMKQSIEYSITANRAILDYASRNRDRLLYNIYRMGRNSIERGSRDNWTVSPADIAEAQAGGRGFEALRRPENRDPRGYVIPSDQPDFLTATKFVNALFRNGVTVHRATAPFRIGSAAYPAGSFVVKAAQAFRPHVLDMFEPQDHPNDFAYAGAPPTAPYDNAGWTLAYQMGVRFDRILEAFEGPFQALQGEARTAGSVTSTERPAGYLFTHEANDSFIAVNRLLAAGQEVYWLTRPSATDGKEWPAGTHYVRATAATRELLDRLARDVGLNFQAVRRAPEQESLRLRPVRIALWDRYGGSIRSGWTRLVLEQFEFPYTVVYAPTLDAGNLNGRFDVLILVDDSEFGGYGNSSNANVPAEYRDRVGSMTETATVPRLKEFLDAGGTILSIGGSTSLGSLLGLALEDALRETLPDGRSQRFPNTKFYIPGSILQARLDTSHPIAYGLPERLDFFFDSSPAFRLGEDARSKGLRTVAWFDKDKPLRSGWAWGQEHLKDTAAVVEATVGKGRLILYGPEILFRAQPHGTFKLLFNGIFAGHAVRASLETR